MFAPAFPWESRGTDCDEARTVQLNGHSFTVSVLARVVTAELEDSG
eukprot:COSAG02_NODE_32222_length_520_cov_0.570071_1_plen_45_part_10